ncbi:M23 family metallopeptidase [Candidatus Peregrinibacteria bacterium]|nr:M23 family metallopeptidase [Candidatus Peregrinibacteria bacterium]
MLRNAFAFPSLPKIVTHLSPLLTVIPDRFISGSVGVRHGAPFPAFGQATYPVPNAPNWGAMRTPQEWNRTFREMSQEDFVSFPAYDLDVLTTPLTLLLKHRNAHIDEITTKLFYSTRHFSAYDLDAGEYTGRHPGVDLKLARETPIASIGGGRVNAVQRTENLGTYVVIEHRIGDDTYYAVYAHLDAASVQTGEDVRAGQTIGTVGLTGNTSGPHLHLQIDRGQPGEREHIPYAPSSIPAEEEAERHTVHPIEFIEEHRG